MRMVDINHDDKISMSEFITACLDRGKVLHKSLLKRVFNMFDIDNSGAIDISELKKIYGNLEHDTYEDDEFWEQLFLEVDNNGNGEISFKEFTELM